MLSAAPEPSIRNKKRGHAGPRFPEAGRLADQSSGSTLKIEAPWLLPTQNVTGRVALSPVWSCGWLVGRCCDRLSGTHAVSLTRRDWR
jgi:hypothetical protein